MSNYDIQNPTKARRVIYDGLKDMKQITIDAGATKKNVPLGDKIVEELQARNEKVPGSDLVVTPTKAENKASAPKA